MRYSQSHSQSYILNSDDYSASEFFRMMVYTCLTSFLQLHLERRKNQTSLIVDLYTPYDSKWWGPLLPNICDLVER